MITDFLHTKLSREELLTVLKAIREFKSNESAEEFLGIPLSAWAKLEQLEEFLEYLVGKGELKPDTLAYMKAKGKDVPSRME